MTTTALIINPNDSNHTNNNNTSNNKHNHHHTNTSTTTNTHLITSHHSHSNNNIHHNHPNSQNNTKNTKNTDKNSKHSNNSRKIRQTSNINCKQFSPEWYFYHLQCLLLSSNSRNTLNTIQNFTRTDILSILSVISEYSQGIRCLYLNQSGYRMADLCEIGNNSTDLHLTDNSFTIECWINLKYSNYQLNSALNRINANNNANNINNTNRRNRNNNNRIHDQSIVGGRSLADQQALHVTIRNMCPHFGFSMKNNKYNNITALDCMLESRIWYHLAFIYNIESKQQLIYVNGRLEACGNKVEPLKGDRDLCISHYFDGRPLYGYLTELRIWNIARSKEEIEDMMYKFDLSNNEINRINSNGNNVVLRKYFTMTSEMKWEQKIKDNNEVQESLDHLVGYN